MNKISRMKLKVNKNRNALVALMMLHIVLLAMVYKYAQLNVADAFGRGMGGATQIVGSIFSSDAANNYNYNSKPFMPVGSLHMSDRSRELLGDGGSTTYSEGEAGLAGGSTDAWQSTFSGALLSVDVDHNAILEASLQRVLGSGWNTSVVPNGQGLGKGTPNTGLPSLGIGGGGGDNSPLASIPVLPFVFPWGHTPLSPVDLPPSLELGNPDLPLDSPITGGGGSGGPGQNGTAPSVPSGQVVEPAANSDASPTPEPCSLILMGLGLAGILSRRIRRAVL